MNSELFYSPKISFFFLNSNSFKFDKKENLCTDYYIILYIIFRLKNILNQFIIEYKNIIIIFDYQAN